MRRVPKCVPGSPLFLGIAADTAKFTGKSIQQIYAHSDANEFKYASYSYA